MKPCSLGRGDGQIAHNSGMRLGAESGMIECPECHQMVAVAPDGRDVNGPTKGWWTIAAHNQQERAPYAIKPPSAQALAVIAALRELTDSEQIDVMFEMGWSKYDDYDTNY